MARNHAKKKTSKDPSFRKKKPLAYFPVQRKIPVGNPVTPTGFTGLLDAARALSQVNHRLYRYGKKYTLKVDVDPSELLSGTDIHLYALADNWMVQKAFEEAKSVFDRAYTDERENLSESQYARWRDFRIASGVTNDTLRPIMRNHPTAGPLRFQTLGTFDLSVVEDSAGNPRTFTWSNNPNVATEYSVINEYNLAANTTVTPGVTTGAGPYDDLEADASQLEMNALQTRGAQPPYDPTGLPPVWIKVGTLTVSGTTGSQKLSTGYFDAPCGIVSIQIEGQNWESMEDSLSFTVQSGDYKGVKAHNMERM